MTGPDVPSGELRCWDDEPGCNCANAGPHPADVTREPTGGQELRVAIKRVRDLHVPSHGYCTVCDVDRDVEALGNAFPCDHYTSFCRGCNFAWPCPTARALDGEPQP